MGEADYSTCKDGVIKLPTRSRAEAATLMRPLNQEVLAQFPMRLLIFWRCSKYAAPPRFDISYQYFFNSVLVSCSILLLYLCCTSIA